MQDTLVPTKLIDLSSLKTKDAKIRRMFILADGERTLAELSKLCGLSFKEAALVALSLVKEGAFSTSGDIIAPPAEQDSSVKISASFNEQVAEILARHLGPIAAVLVNKKFPLEQTLSRAEIEAQFRTLIQAVDDEREQEQCLADLRSIG